MPPLSDQKIDQDTQRLPKPSKFCFCVTAAARPLCIPWTTKTVVVAQQVLQRRQSGGKTIAKVAQGSLWSLNGGTVVTTAIAQWTLLVSQRKHNGGTREAEASLKLIHNIYNSTHFLDQRPTPVHPFCNHGDVCVFFLPPLSDLWATNLLSDLCATVLNMLKISRWPWHPWRCPLCHPWKTKATFWTLLCLQWWPGQFCGHTKEAQRSQPLCKGGIIAWCH